MPSRQNCLSKAGKGGPNLLAKVRIEAKTAAQACIHLNLRAMLKADPDEGNDVVGKAATGGHGRHGPGQVVSQLQ